MAQAAGVSVSRAQQPDGTTAEHPSGKGKVVPLPGAAQGKGANEQGLSDQELVAVLSFLLL